MTGNAFDSKYRQHLHLAFLYYVAAASGNWGYFSSQCKAWKKSSDPTPSRGVYDIALIYFDYLSKIGENGTRC